MVGLLPPPTEALPTVTISKLGSLVQGEAKRKEAEGECTARHSWKAPESPGSKGQLTSPRGQLPQRGDGGVSKPDSLLG